MYVLESRTSYFICYVKDFNLCDWKLNDGVVTIQYASRGFQDKRKKGRTR